MNVIMRSNKKGIQMAEETKTVEKTQSEKEKKLDELQDRIIKNYEVIGERLGKFLETWKKNELFGEIGWVKKGRKVVSCWDTTKRGKETLAKAISEIKKGLMIILDRLDKIEEVDVKLDEEHEGMHKAKEEEDKEKVIYFCFEKLGEILAKFDRIWKKNEKLEIRKNKIFGSEKVETMGVGSKGLDGMLQGFIREMIGEPWRVFKKTNKEKIKEIRDEFNELKKTNKELIELIEREGRLVKNELRLAKEEEELVGNLVRGMKKHQSRLEASMRGYKAMGFKRRAEKVGDILRPYKDLSIPAELNDELVHFKTDLAAEELKILHMQITPRIVMVYNATMELWKLLKDENEEIEKLDANVKKIEEIQEEPSKDDIKPKIDKLCYDTRDSLKGLSSLFFKKEMPLAKRIKAIQNSIERAYDYVKKIEEKRRGIELERGLRYGKGGFIGRKIGGLSDFMKGAREIKE